MSKYCAKGHTLPIGIQLCRDLSCGDFEDNGHFCCALLQNHEPALHCDGCLIPASRIPNAADCTGDHWQDGKCPAWKDNCPECGHPMSEQEFMSKVQEIIIDEAVSRGIQIDGYVAMSKAILALHEQEVKQKDEALREAKLQIEYLHGKFKETGSGNAVIAKIDAALEGK